MISGSRGGNPALFTGRLPGFAASYLGGLVRWQGRVLGYQLLLTGQYPPFSFEDEDYPVRVAMRPGPLNRLAVLFRYVLMVPALVVNLFVLYGVLVISIAVWLIALVTGKCRTPCTRPSAITSACWALASC